MAKAAAGIPDQIRATLAGAAAVVIPASRFDEVVLVGSHPTAFAAEMFEATLGPLASVPVVTASPGELPGFVDADSFVVAISVSGDDSLVVSSAEKAVGRGACLACVTGDGELAELAREESAGVVALGQMPRPRSAVVAILTAIGALVERAGLVVNAAESFDGAASQAEARLFSPVVDATVPGEIARRIGRTFPFIVGASGVGAAAAAWWRSEIAANARTLGLAESVPALFSDTIAAFGQSGDVTRQVLTLVVLRSSVEPPRADEFFSSLDDQLLEVVSDVVSVNARGSTPTAELIDLVIVGELVSLGLAAALGIDPGPAPAIDETHLERPGPRTAGRRRDKTGHIGHDGQTAQTSE